MTEQAAQADQPAAQPVAPPDVYLSGTAGWDPSFPTVGSEIVYYWDETNRGGKHPDTYHANVQWSDPDGNILDTLTVDCTPLDTNESAHRTTTLPAPTKAGMGFTIQAWIDVDHHTEFSEGYNQTWHTVDVEEAGF